MQYWQHEAVQWNDENARMYMDNNIVSMDP